MPSQVNLGVVPIGGGTVQSLLTESIWLGGGRFLTVYTQRTPNMLNVQITDLSADPYAAGTPTQTVTTNQMLLNVTPLDRPMLIRLDINRVLMIWSATNLADNFVTGSTTIPATLAFDATILEIDASNNVTIKASVSQVLPVGAVCFTQAYNQPTASKGIQANSTNPLPTTDFTAGPGFSTYLPLSADGASVNRVLAAVRTVLTLSNGGASVNRFSIYDFQYNVATTTLTVSPKFTSPAVTFGYPNAYSVPLNGPNDFAWLFAIPGTTNIICGAINYDPTNGGASAASIDVLRSWTSQTQFVTGNVYYVFDTTQTAATWTAATTISTGRKASLVTPLDSDRMLEMTSQVCTTGSTNYGRIYSLSAGTWGPDIVTDASNALVNKNGSFAYGLVNQMTMLGNDRMIFSVTTRPAAASGVGLTGTAYYGIYRLLAGTLLQTTASFGVPLLAPLTFQRGADAIIKRSAGQDPANTSPNIAYDFYGKTSPTSYQFIRYPNPM